MGIPNMARRHTLVVYKHVAYNRKKETSNDKQKSPKKKKIKVCYEKSHVLALVILSNEKFKQYSLGKITV